MTQGERGKKGARSIDFFLGVPICFVLGMLKGIRSRRNFPSRVNSVGIFVFGAIGDALLSSVIANGVRKSYPDANVVLYLSVANKSAARLLDESVCTRVVPITKLCASAIMLFNIKHDIIIDTTQWARIPSLYCLLTRSRYLIGFETHKQFRHYVYDLKVVHRNDQHEIDNFRALCNAARANGNVVGPALKENLPNVHLPESVDGVYVVIHPWAGGFKASLREWPEENWTRLIRILSNSGAYVLVSGSGADVRRSSALVALCGCSKVASIAGMYSLEQLAVVLKRSAGLISVNTGIMHLASVLGVPTVSLNGPTNSRRWGAVSENSKNVDVPKEFGGGFLNLGFEYPRGAKNVMNVIEVSCVVNAWKSLHRDSAINLQ